MEFFCPICKDKTQTVAGPSVFSIGTIEYTATCFNLRSHIFKACYDKNGKAHYEKSSFKQYSVHYQYRQRKIVVIDHYTGEQKNFLMNFDGTVNHLVSEESIKDFLLL